jgi:uncharacterized coiled-coil protein SlyX
MDKPATKSDLKDMKDQIQGRFEKSDIRLDKLDGRMDKLEIKLGVLNVTIDQLSESTDTRFDHVEAKLDRLLNILDSRVGETETQEIEMASRDAKADRHERWILQLANNAKLQLA